MDLGEGHALVGALLLNVVGLEVLVCRLGVGAAAKLEERSEFRQEVEEQKAFLRGNTD